MYTNLASVKAMLGISWNNQDNILTKLIADAEVYLNSMLKIDSFDEWDYVEQIQIKTTATKQFYSKIRLKNFNVTAITKINWTAYTGVKWTDYVLSNWRVLNIKDIYNYIGNLDLPFFDIEYTAWFKRTPGADELPAWVEMMTRLLVAWMYQEQYPMWYSTDTNWLKIQPNIKSYTLWAESISLGKYDTSWHYVSFRKEEEASMFQQLFSKYKKANVIW